LIGWADNPQDLTNNVTINDIHPAGLHETLIQAPLSINLMGSLNLPPNFIAGQLIDVTSNNVQIRYPGVYSITSGSMTFEYVVPESSNVQVNGLTIAEPPDAQVGSVSDTNSSSFRLYNWHTNSWDTISLNQNTFTTNKVGTYISAAGRVLLQFTNKDSQLGSLEFGKPIINLQGVISGQLSVNN
jgi:RNase P/RNase MRP subunit p29